MNSDQEKQSKKKKKCFKREENSQYKTWISGILATNERNYFLARTLDSTTLSIDEKRQHVLSSLNMGYSLAQVTRLKSQYVKEYDKLVVDYISKMTEVVDGVPKFIILAFDDDFAHGWFINKFMNKWEDFSQYLKNLTVMTIDFVQVCSYYYNYNYKLLYIIHFCFIIFLSVSSIYLPTYGKILKNMRKEPKRIHGSLLENRQQYLRTQ